VFLIAFFSCQKKKNSFLKPMPLKVFSADSHRVESYNFVGLSQFLNRKNDTLYIYNFWATWCEPCVEELPYFELMQEKYKNAPLKVFLVSLDFPKNIENRLLPFIVKNKIESEVVHLNDPDANAWIEKVNKEWSGAIPATLFIKNDSKLFFEQSFDEENLEQIIQTLLNKKS
jgi:thiol-disulfide isomerase/thioredoxin